MAMDISDHLSAIIAGLFNLAADHPDRDTVKAILEEAVRFSTMFLEPGGKEADRLGCRLENGRVVLPECQTRSWQAFLENGWNHVSAPEFAGGQALPLTVATSVQMIFDQADAALSMLALNQRCAMRLLVNVAPLDLQELWLPRLARGEWGATICISEPNAGSDVGRIRAVASVATNNLFRITGQKCWISYGDHNLTKGIVHFILARSPDLPAGTRGLTLFLLPDQLEDGNRNGVSVLRIEGKLGLHASPTCVLSFEDALATPLSAPGRGLAALFEMIIAMRLGVAAQGCAIATRAAAIAANYAAERYQGGTPDKPPVPIHHHAEVRRALLEMQLTADTMTILTMQAAAWVDSGDKGDLMAAARAGVLLPVAKALASEAGFNNASQAIQILGGAGYTQEWPVERLLRDSRVFSIYEGTTAIQAMDLAFRQILGAGAAAARDVLDQLQPLPALRTKLNDLIGRLRNDSRGAQEQAALPLLRLFGLACVDGLLRRYASTGPLTKKFSALLAVHETSLEYRMDFFLAQSAAQDMDTPYHAIFAD